MIWQVGTNDALVGVDESLFRATVESGNPQLTTITTNPARYERFVAIVDDIGARLHVPVLSRYAMMKRLGAKAAALISRDGLHMNDLGYRCLAHAIAEEIEGASAAEARAGGELRAGAKL